MRQIVAVPFGHSGRIWQYLESMCLGLSTTHYPLCPCLFALTMFQNKPEILFGANNILDLVISMIENLESATNTDSEVSINTIHCKLCHLISIVGRTQLSVQHLTRILVLLRDSLLGKNRRLLASLLLSTLKDMTEHSPPFYDNHLQHQLQSGHHSSGGPPSANSSPNHPHNKKKHKLSAPRQHSATSSHSEHPKEDPAESSSWMPSPQRLFSNKATKIVNSVLPRWFDTGSSAPSPNEPPKTSSKSTDKKPKRRSTASRNGGLPNTNTLSHIIHQLPLSSFAFLNTNRQSGKQCSIDVPMKYIRKWPYERGFTFVCWVLYHQLSPPVYNQNPWMTIFTMLTSQGYGVHISLCCKSGSIKVRITAKNLVDEKIIPKARLLAQTWYSVGITHSQSRTAALRLLRPSHSNGQCKVYINGSKITSIDMEYPEIGEKPKYCSIGR